MKRSRQDTGGSHQRFASARSFGGGSSSQVAPARPGSGAPDLRPGHLDGDPEVDVLIEFWSLGVISAKTLQAIAAVAVLVAPSPAMNELASLSNVHLHRDLTRKLVVV